MKPEQWETIIKHQTRVEEQLGFVRETQECHGEKIEALDTRIDGLDVRVQGISSESKTTKSGLSSITENITKVVIAVLLALLFWAGNELRHKGGHVQHGSVSHSERNKTGG